MVQVIWTDESKRDLKAIGDYLRKSSAEFAETVVFQIYESVGRLYDFPRLGRVVPEFNIHDIRELIHDGYRIVYLLHEDEVHILAVLHGKQDLVKKLSRRK
jgi:addiction module RelE/StbE family toxin